MAVNLYSPLVKATITDNISFSVLTKHLYLFNEITNILGINYQIEKLPTYIISDAVQISMEQEDWNLLRISGLL